MLTCLQTTFIKSPEEVYSIFETMPENPLGKMSHPFKSTSLFPTFGIILTGMSALNLSVRLSIPTI